MNFKDYVANYPLISEEQISKIFNNLLKDSQDLVRMYLVDSLVALFKSSLMSKNQQMIINNLKLLAEDQSWRIKYYICEQIQPLIDSL